MNWKEYLNLSEKTLSNEFETTSITGFRETSKHYGRFAGEVPLG